jgi:peptide/nickel transport system substrate-binding protein
VDATLQHWVGPWPSAAYLATGAGHPLKSTDLGPIDAKEQLTELRFGDFRPHKGNAEMDRRTLLKGITFAAAAGPHLAFAQSKSNTLRWATDLPVTAIDPYYNVYREATIINAEMVWDTLIYREPRSGEFLGLLARSWKWVDDSTLDFELRDDVAWHDGQPLTPEDVVYTVNYVADPSKKVNVQSNVNWMKSAEQTGPHSVRLHLKAPFAPALNYVAGLVPIMPKDFYGEGGQAGAGGRLVGTGPYRIANFVPGSSIDLQRSETYFTDSPKGRGLIEKINFRTIPDRATQIAELLSGGLDWVWNVPSDQAARLASLSKTVIPAESMRISYLAFNTRDMDIANPMKDRRVREAVACAVDREAIVQNIIGEGSSVVRAACFRTQFGCAQDVAQFSYDPERAKKLLAEAGYADGLTLEFVAYRNREWMEAVTSYLNAVGINTNITFQQYAAAHQRVVDNKSIHIFQADWGAYSINDVSVTLNNFFTLSVDDMARDQEVSDWVKKASQTTDENVRKELYDKALNRIADEVYWLPLWVHPVVYACAADLDFSPYSDENPRFYFAKWK